MTGREVSSALRLLEKIEGGLGTTPYSDAIGAIGRIEELRTMIRSELPGSFLGYCDNCDAAVGDEEDYRADPDLQLLFCETCTAEHVAQA